MEPTIFKPRLKFFKFGLSSTEIGTVVCSVSDPYHFDLDPDPDPDPDPRIRIRDDGSEVTLDSVNRIIIYKL